MNEPKESVIYEFGQFRIDLRKRQLYKEEVSVQMTAKAFDTLVALIAADGETVLKADLMDTVWPETSVEENNLTQQVSALRKAFGERATDHKFIVTVPGQGYRFVAEVRQMTIDETVEPNLQPIHSFKSMKRHRAEPSGWYGYAIAVIYVLTVCVPAFVTAWRAEMRGIKPQAIAIMQFRSTGAGDELLGMGIRDTLRAKLGSLDDVTVRPSVPDIAENVIDAGKQLDADLVLTGSIQHDEDKIRVAVEMVDVSNQRIMWGNTFDDNSSNKFELQDSITSAVVSALKRPKSSSSLHTPLHPDSGSEDRELAAIQSWRPPLRRNDIEYAAS